MTLLNCSWMQKILLTGWLKERLTNSLTDWLREMQRIPWTDLSKEMQRLPWTG
jgi:hypothetical protein